MFEKIIYNDKNETIAFLNTKAIEFYDGKIKFEGENRKYFGVFKAAILSALSDIEKTIKGTFLCNFSMSTIDMDKMKLMYPHVVEMFQIKSLEDWKNVGELLRFIRNINAHAFIDESDFFIFKKDYSFLANERKINDEVEYLFDGDITIAGLIFIILNFLRENSISKLSKKSYAVSCVAENNGRIANGVTFVNEISHVNLEVPIREKKGSDIISSTLGELIDFVNDGGDTISISFGNLGHPTFLLNATMNDKIIVVEKGSLTRTYYRDEYQLKIAYKEGFIELSNNLPSMVLVDYLYEASITVFDKKTYKTIINNMNLVSKLNYPKFYCDKNIQLLLYGENASDLRMMSSLITEGLFNVFVSTEDFIYRTRRINRRSSRTIFTEALEAVNIPSEIIREASFLRNFSAHGYMLNDYGLYDDEARQYSIDYIISTLKLMMDYFKDNITDLDNHFYHLIDDNFIKKILKSKYKKAIECSQEVILNYPNYDKKELLKKNKFIENSYFDTSVLNQLVRFTEHSMRILEIDFGVKNGNLYFYNNGKSRIGLLDFEANNGFKETQKINNGIIIHIQLNKEEM